MYLVGEASRLLILTPNFTAGQSGQDNDDSTFDAVTNRSVADAHFDSAGSQAGPSSLTRIIHKFC